tara:strand:+ start:768 stop:992 length:225 start_codon:yes stop_codon:yes gene_type:complete
LEDQKRKHLKRKNKEAIMPMVGKKKFPYTDKGKEAAYNYAKNMNQPIQDVNNFGSSGGMSLDKNRFGRRDKNKY